MKEREVCYKLLKHYRDHSEVVVAVSHDKEKLVKALPLVNSKGWKVLSENQLEFAHQREENYFAITTVTYL